MEQKKCSLCEGKIIGGRCLDCGMYYREIEGRYFLNRNRDEGETEIPMENRENSQNSGAARKWNQKENLSTNRNREGRPGTAMNRTQPHNKGTNPWRYAEKTAGGKNEPETIKTRRQQEKKRKKDIKRQQFFGAILPVLVVVLIILCEFLSELFNS